MRMPWRDPELYPIIIAAFLAMLTAFLRSLYDGGRTWKARLVESMLIGSLTVGIGFGLKAMGADGSWVFFAGSVVGLFGVDYIRAVGKDALKKRLEK